jgi:hypothetical protein
MGRIDIPANFYDKTSDLLLVQPTPQFLYARLFLGALRASLAPPDLVGLPFRPVQSAGAQYTDLEKNQLALSNPVMTSLITGETNFQGLPGSTIRFNRPVFTQTTYTETGRRLNGVSISTTPVKPQSEQNSLTLFLYGGPYDSANSRVAPYGIDAFQAQMGVHKLSQIVGANLQYDCHHFLDSVFVALGNLGSTTVYPDQISTDDGMTSRSFPLTLEQVLRAEATADSNNLPTFPDGFRVFVGTPVQIEQLGLDPAYRQSGQFFPEYNALFPQYVKSVSKLHIFRSSTLSIDNNTPTIPIHKGHLLCPGVFLGGMGRALRVAAASDDNYGETAKVVWLGDMAFGLSDDRLVLGVHSSATA